MPDNSATRAGNIKKFDIQSHKKGNNKVSLDAGIVELKYFESVLSNTISASVTVADAGLNDGKGAIDTLPIRGGEEVSLVMEDAQAVPNQLSFTQEKSFYINRVRGIDPGTQKDIYTIDLSPKEFFANEQTRVVRKFSGQPSNHVASIINDLDPNTNIVVDKTIRDYNFIGNDKKPFYVCTWLASKSIPELSVDGKNSLGGSAGYFFYQTYDALNFRALDKMLDPTAPGNSPRLKCIFNKNADMPTGYNTKILNVNIERDIDLQKNLTVGAYNNRSLFFDFVSMKYDVRDYSVEKQKEQINNTGAQDITEGLPEEFTKSPTRIFNHVLDQGLLPPSGSIEDQLKYWKDNKDVPTYDARDTMVQSVMRYNQLFSIKTNIIIPGNFSLRAGDLIQCDFPDLTVDQNKETNRQTGGIYMIASVCHRMTQSDTFTSLSLVRDTFGRKVLK